MAPVGLARPSHLTRDEAAGRTPTRRFAYVWRSVHFRVARLSTAAEPVADRAPAPACLPDAGRPPSRVAVRNRDRRGARRRPRAGSRYSFPAVFAFISCIRFSIAAFWTAVQGGATPTERA